MWHKWNVKEEFALYALLATSFQEVCVSSAKDQTAPDVIMQQLLFALVVLRVHICRVLLVHVRPARQDVLHALVPKTV